MNDIHDPSDKSKPQENYNIFPKKDWEVLEVIIEKKTAEVYGSEDNINL